MNLTPKATQTKKQLAWSGSTAELRSLIETVGHQASKIQSRPRQPDGNGLDEFTIVSPEITLAETDLDTKITGSIEVLDTPDIDLTRLASVIVRCGDRYGPRTILLEMRRTGTERGVQLTVSGTKAEVVAAHAVIWRKVRERKPWWSFLAHDDLPVIGVGVSGVLLVAVAAIYALLTGSSESNESSGGFVGLFTLIGVAAFGAVYLAGVLLHRHVFPSLEVNENGRQPKSRRFRTAFWTFLGSAVFGTALALVFT